MGLATIVVVFLGPVFAVLTARYLDKLRADKERKLDIFRTLMRTRGVRLHWEHVGALNLVEVEFIDHPAVVNAWKEYLTNLGEALPAIEEKDRFDSVLRKRGALLTRLIDEIAKVLGIEVKQLDILEGNYVPQGWDDAEWEQQLVRRGLINVLYGKASIPIQPHQPQQQQNPYPPPPTAKYWSYPVSVDSLGLSSPALRWAKAGGRTVFSQDRSIGYPPEGMS